MGKARKQKQPPPDGITPVAENRKARHDFEIIDTLECGMVLRGTEVKSLRDRRVHFADGYGLLKNGELWLLGMVIDPWPYGTHENHTPDRTRKLLVNRDELRRLDRATGHKGATLVPLKLYFKKGRAKVLIGIAKGRTKVDKREDLKKKEADRDVARALRRGNR